MPHETIQTASMLMTVQRMVVLAIVTAGIGPSFAAESQPSTAAHVALLEAEYITPDTKAARRELTGWLDTVLTDSLARQKDLALVDRQALDRVLAERNLAKLDARTADASLRPFIASGVLICPTIVADAKSGKAVVMVQAVLAQRGTLLSEMSAVRELAGDGWKTAPALDQPLKQFWQDMRRQLETNLSLPGLEVRRIGITSKLDRLQWMVDDLTDAMTVAPREGLALLVPRQPIHTKEERLLRLMGLGSPGEGDKSAKLSAASDFQLSGELAKEVKAGVPFEQTPVKFTLRLSGGGKELAGTELAGTAGQYPDIRRQALAWAAKELSRIARVRPQVLDESHAKALAQQELAVARRLAAVSYGASSTERDRQERLAMAALRACHLDPASEGAAYLAATCIEGMYEARQQGQTLACKDRILQFGQQYLDRFGDKVAKHHCEVLARIGSAGHSGAWIIRGKPGGTEAITSQPDVRQYPYASAYVRAFMEMGVRGATDKVYDCSNSLQSAPGHLRMHLIPNIPDDKVDEEYRFWRELWQKRVKPLGEGKCIPWDCVEMGFAARRKDAQGVRAAAQRLAAKYPKSKSDIWRLVQDDTVALYLSAADDPQWNTWQPAFGQPSPPKIDYNLARNFYQDWRPPVLSAWDYSRALAMPGTCVTFPKSIAMLGAQQYGVSYPKLECFLVAGGDAWFVGPCLWDRINNRPHHLLATPTKSLSGMGTVEAAPVEVLWPESPKRGSPPKQGESDLPSVTCWHVTTDSEGNDTVWIGTMDRGLARFEKRDGKWVGQWYAGRQGMPSERISTIRSFRSGKCQKLLLVGGGPRDQRGTKLFIWSLDIQSGQIKLLADMDAAYSMGFLTAVWPDGRRVPLSVYNESDHDGLDLEKVREIVCTGPRLPDWYVEGINLRLMQTDGASRLWQIGNGRRSEIREMAPLSLEVLPYPMIPGPVTLGDDGHVPAPCRFSGLAWQDLSEGLPRGPLDKTCSSLVVGQDIWMVVRPYEHVQHHGEGYYVMLYRPAPQGDKDWASHDQWIGPFKPTGSGPIFSIAADNEGGVWVTGVNAVYRVDAKTLLEQARQAGLGISTERWRQELEKRVEQADWRVRLRVMLARKQFKQSLKLVETKVTTLGEVTSASSQSDKSAWTQTMLYKAFVLACLARWDNSLAVYTTVRRSETCVDPGRRYAAEEFLWVLVGAERWADFLKEVEAQDLKISKDTIWAWYVKHARRELDKASKPSAPRAQPSRQQ